MPFPPPNSQDPTDASQSRSQGESPLSFKQADLSEAEAQAVETFAFDVGAGPRQSENTNLPISPLAPRKTSPRKTDLQFAPEKPGKIDALNEIDARNKIKGLQESSPTPLDVQSGRAVTQAKASRGTRFSSWWLTSFGVHALLIFSLAFSTLAVMQEEELELYASPAVYEPLEEFEDLEIDPPFDAPLSPLEEEAQEKLGELGELEEEREEMDPDVFANLNDELLSADMLVDTPLLSEDPFGEATPTDVPTSLSDLSPLVGGGSTSLTGLDGNIGDDNVGSDMLGDGTDTGNNAAGSMARFFGTEIKARRILYLLDNSGGMRRGGKFEALVDELLASVQALSPKQEFYVLFYSDTVYPLFYPHSVRKFVSPNKRNKKQLKAWLDSVELCGGNAIDEALAAAEVIRPDAIFLLTDGDLFTTQEKEALLLNRHGRRYSIHTFGLGVGKTTKTAAGLQRVAEANNGTFRVIKVSDEAKALAKTKIRLYHKDSPGPVWGLKVGSW